MELHPPWVVEVFVHPGHPFHPVPVGLEVWVVLVPHILIYFSDFGSIVVVLDLMVVVNHLLHHHIQCHHHHCHLLLHHPLGEAFYHPLHSHHHSHYHFHCHQVEEPFFHLLVIEAFLYLFPQMVGQFLHPHHLVVVEDLHHPQQVGWTFYHLALPMPPPPPPVPISSGICFSIWGLLTFSFFFSVGTVLLMGFCGEEPWTNCSFWDSPFPNFKCKFHPLSTKGSAMCLTNSCRAPDGCGASFFFF